MTLVTVCPPGIRSAAAPSGGFVTPNLINHENFPGGAWSQLFNGSNNGFGVSTGVGTPADLASTPDFAIVAGHSRVGSFSVRTGWAPNGNEVTLANCWPQFAGAYDEIWFAFDIEVETAWPSTPFKFFRFQDNTGSCGGLFTYPPSGGLVFGFDIEDQAISTYIGVSSAQLIDNGVNNFEGHYMRNAGSNPVDNPNNWPAFESWFNGVKNTHVDTTPGGGSVAYWKNNVYYAGERARSLGLRRAEMVNTMNAGNANTGECWMSNLSCSSAGRIGPN